MGVAKNYINVLGVFTVCILPPFATEVFTKFTKNAVRFCALLPT